MKSRGAVGEEEVTFFLQTKINRDAQINTHENVKNPALEKTIKDGAPKPQYRNSLSIYSNGIIHP